MTANISAVPLPVAHGRPGDGRLRPPWARPRQRAADARGEREGYFAAWSKVGGKLRWDPRAHLQQYRYDYSGGGLTLADVNRALFEDFGQWSLREPKEEEMPIDVVHDPDAVTAAREKLEATGLLAGRDHRSDDAASVGLLMVLVARLLDQVTGPVDLEEYELRLVKKGG